MNIHPKIESNSIPEPNSGCLLWLGGCCGAGYGAVRDGNSLKSTHVISYEHAYGPVPRGLLVLHKCDVKLCCNPTHLYVGNDADNACDRVIRGQQARGERHGRAFLSDEEIREIREADGYHKDIAAKFGISRTHVTNIKNGFRRKSL